MPFEKQGSQRKRRKTNVHTRRPNKKANKNARLENNNEIQVPTIHIPTPKCKTPPAISKSAIVTPSYIETIEDDEFIMDEMEDYLSNEVIKSSEIFKDPEATRRSAIAFLFTTKYGGKPNTPFTPWYGKDGIIEAIRKDLGLKERCAVAYILEDVLEIRKLNEGKEEKDWIYYCPKQCSGAGRKCQLTKDDPEAQIAAMKLKVAAV
ncbi:predicted protein [Chaetoceros tenuissimus]|uniref:Uncharacterized protein n=1 Tax=Chaetoceros tenuissimus TaxID=426638 RepID=A0AAD3CZ24_9STRA|nr:predicted protein [Chaetoceros tenuissimus]